MRIKQSGWLLALLLTCGASHAGELCDAQCELTIDFPGGGQIAAIAALTITFGDGGLVDTGGAVTAYLENETLSLAAGESLEFEAGGRFDIGAAGNIEYTDMEFVTDGALELNAVGGAEAIQIMADDRLAFGGSGSFTLSSLFNGGGTLELLGGLLVIPTAAGTPGGGTPAPSGSSLTIGAGSLTLNGSSLDVGSPAEPLVISGSGSLSTSPGIVLDPTAITAVLSDPLVFESVTFDPVIAPPAANAGLLTLDSEDETNAAAIDPAWLLLLTLAGLGRARPGSRVTRGDRHDNTLELR